QVAISRFDRLGVSGLLCGVGRRGRRLCGRRRGRGLGVRRCGRGWGVSLAVELRMRLQFVLRRLRYQPAIAVLLGPLQLVVVEGDILGSHAKETADAYDD